MRVALGNPDRSTVQKLLKRYGIQRRARSEWMAPVWERDQARMLPDAFWAPQERAQCRESALARALVCPIVATA